MLLFFRMIIIALIMSFIMFTLCKWFGLLCILFCFFLCMLLWPYYTAYAHCCAYYHTCYYTYYYIFYCAESYTHNTHTYKTVKIRYTSHTRSDTNHTSIIQTAYKQIKQIIHKSYKPTYKNIANKFTTHIPKVIHEYAEYILHVGLSLLVCFFLLSLLLWSYCASVWAYYAYGYAYYYASHYDHTKHCMLIAMLIVMRVIMHIIRFLIMHIIKAITNTIHTHP